GMILVDTGYFIALLTPSDALHQRACAWAEAVDEPLLVTEYVLWECVNHLSLPEDREKAKALAQRVRLGNECVFVAASPELLDAGLRLHASRMDKAWSLTDCVSFVVMQERGITRALAYDQHFAQGGFEPLLRRDP
ncbi:MAG: PIN domain-containing protein, partial [Planctomycetota bacterium]|nr:PIN domain-containing protein [Planctomycetota bacterium]